MKINNRNEIKLRILWFCNLKFSGEESKTSGSWLNALGSALVENEHIELCNITAGNVKRITRQDFGEIMQWIVPYQSKLKCGLPKRKIIKEIQEIVKQINPSIIHVWGTENYFGVLTAQKYINGTVILEIQGLKYAIEKYFYAGLNTFNLFKCIAFKDFLRPSESIFQLKSAFSKWGKIEKEIIRNHSIISVQSNWSKSQVQAVNPGAKILETKRALRKEFYVASQWNAEACTKYRIFTSLASIISYKGLHILIDSISLLKKKYPKIKLAIAGYRAYGLRQNGYTKWLTKRIQKLGLVENIEWLGMLDSGKLIAEMHKANVTVIPSFIESYCLGLFEALAIGVPTVVSFAGAMPELATHEVEALFFQPGDAIMCANCIERFLESEEFAISISNNSIKRMQTNKVIDVSQVQYAIYRRVLINH